LAFVKHSLCGWQPHLLLLLLLLLLLKLCGPIWGSKRQLRQCSSRHSTLQL
jgi:hypothetical protein